jgi:hypothetical protein
MTSHGVWRMALTVGHISVPSNLVMKRVSPRWWLAGLTTIWGVIAMAMGFVQSYVSLVSPSMLIPLHLNNDLSVNYKPHHRPV